MRLATVILIGCLLFGLTANADDAAKALAAAKQLYPATEIRSATPTAIPGVFKFNLGGEFLYGDITARYLILGKLLDMQEIQQISSVTKVSLDNFFAAQAAGIKLQDGFEKGVVLFSDPLCPYCVQLEQRLFAGELDDFNIHLVLVAFQPGSEQLVKKILCSEDPASSYRAYMLSGSEPENEPTCSNTIPESHREIANLIGIRATPTLLAPNGVINEGVPALGQLRAWAESQQMQ